MIYGSKHRGACAMNWEDWLDDPRARTEIQHSMLISLSAEQERELRHTLEGNLKNKLGDKTELADKVWGKDFGGMGRAIIQRLTPTAIL